MSRPRPARAALLLAALLAAAASAADPAPVRRVVSLNPSLTAILLELGAGETLVGVDEVSAEQRPELAGRATVGGLFTPNLEAIVALRPDAVVMVPSAQQRDLHARLESLGVRVVAFPNIRLEELLDSIESLGRLVGREDAARARVEAIRSAWAREREARAGQPRVRAVLVLQRDPLFVVGGGSYLDAMLSAAGARNLAADFAEPYPRVSLEWLIAARPEVILDASPDPDAALAFWRRWPSLPAVERERVVPLPMQEVTLPGPHLERSLARLAAALHGKGAP